MSILNPLAREISAKVVYYGPGLSGKTTSLKQIYESVKPQRRGELVTLATEGDRTIFFDFLPLHVKQVKGMGVRFQLYTVPGQVFYEATRRLVLQGADGVVFVADSQAAAREANLQSLEDLRRNLDEMDVDVESFPVVFQWNKRDLPNVMSTATMSAELNWIGAPELETEATTGLGVLDALREVSKLVIRALWKRAPLPTGARSMEQRAPEEGIAVHLARVAELSSAEIAVPPESQPPELIPEGALTFARLWEGSDATSVARVEQAIRVREHGRAVELAAAALAELLESL
ncbi:MAG: GTPase, partial [Sandaracinaceae bacterium]|nr:GTPase [Sandaracinaceae bacterium]